MFVTTVLIVLIIVLIFLLFTSAERKLMASIKQKKNACYLSLVTFWQKQLEKLKSIVSKSLVAGKKEAVFQMACLYAIAYKTPDGKSYLYDENSEKFSYSNVIPKSNKPYADMSMRNYPTISDPDIPLGFADYFGEYRSFLHFWDTADTAAWWDMYIRESLKRERIEQIKNPFKGLIKGSAEYWHEIDKLRQQIAADTLYASRQALGVMNEWEKKWRLIERYRVDKIRDDYLIFKSSDLNEEKYTRFQEAAQARIEIAIASPYQEYVKGARYNPYTYAQQGPSKFELVSHRFADYFYTMKDAFLILNDNSPYKVRESDDLDVCGRSAIGGEGHYNPSYSFANDNFQESSFVALYNGQTGYPLYVETSKSHIHLQAAEIEGVAPVELSARGWKFARYMIHPEEVPYNWQTVDDEFFSLAETCRLMKYIFRTQQKEMVDLHLQQIPLYNMRYPGRVSFFEKNIDIINIILHFDILKFICYFVFIIGLIAVVLRSLSYFFREGWVEVGEYGTFGKHRYIVAGIDDAFDNVKRALFFLFTFWSGSAFLLWGYLPYSLLFSNYHSYYHWLFIIGRDWLASRPESWRDEPDYGDPFSTFSAALNDGFPDKMGTYLLHLQNQTSFLLYYAVFFFIMVAIYLFAFMSKIYYQVFSDMGNSPEIVYSKIRDPLHVYNEELIWEYKSLLKFFKKKKKIFLFIWFYTFIKKYKNSIFTYKLFTAA